MVVVVVVEIGLHPRLQLHLQECVHQGNVSEWMVRGRMVLIQKDPKKDTQANNYRPIACLPIMWKLLNHGREAVPTPGEEWTARR